MANRLQVIYIEDDALVRRASVQSLQLAGFDVAGFESAEAAEKAIVADTAGVIVSDIRLPGASGLDVLAQCRERVPDVPVILVTGHGDISMAVQAMRDGAYDFIEKPFAAERLIETVRRALERRELVLENHALRRELAGQNVVAPRIIGRSPAIEQVRKLIANVAPTDASVLINGDTGAGKELIARSLHELSPRRAATSRSSRSIAARCPSRCSSRRCSATSPGRSPVRRSGASASSNTRPAARCSSTKSKACRSRCR